MAVRITGKQLPDTKLRKAIGVGLPFSSGAVFNSTYTTAAQVKSNLQNYFLTDPGERYMNINFGFGIKSVLFEQMVDSTFGALKARIESDLKNYFPYVVITNLEVKVATFQQSTIQVILAYQVPDYNLQDTLSLTVVQ